MGIWDNIKDGFRSGQMGKGPNYVRKQREAQARFEGLMAQAALRAWSNYQSQREADSRWRDSGGGRGHSTQYRDGDVQVEVVNGYSRDLDQYTTDIKIIHRDPRITQHLHVVFDELGNEIVNEWRDNHKR